MSRLGRPGNLTVRCQSPLLRDNAERVGRYIPLDSMTSKPTTYDAFTSVDEAICRDDFEEAFRLALPWAEAGYGWALLSVGTMYFGGKGTAVDLQKAQQCLTAAAELGIGGAHYTLGVLLEYTMVSTESTREQAEAHYNEARKLGYSPGDLMPKELIALRRPTATA